MESFYIYYRIDPARREAALTAVDIIFEQVQARCAIRGRLMQRADDANTWMEVFEGVVEAQMFRSALEEIVVRSGLTDMLADESERHVEHFRSLAQT
ncbi:MAG: hypothetical protein JWN23_3223 [Rhodocyclales bacterium]|nr:hypothetical protein [Rhodocyclales bacterium]